MAKRSDTPDFFRPRLADRIDLRYPLAVLASRLPWARIEVALTPFRRSSSGSDFGRRQQTASATKFLRLNSALTHSLRQFNAQCIGIDTGPGVEAIGAREGRYGGRPHWDVRLSRS